MAPPSNSSWLDTPCSLLIRPCCPLPPSLPRMSGRSVGRQFCTLDLSCCEDGSGYLSFAVLSSLPSCRLFPFRNVTLNVRNHCSLPRVCRKAPRLPSMLCKFWTFLMLRRKWTTVQLTKYAVTHPWRLNLQQQHCMHCFYASRSVTFR